MIAFYASLLALERLRPLRPWTDRSLGRVLRNVAVAVPLGLAALLVDKPLTTIASAVALDYAMYLWHRLSHAAPWLWRIHRVHHADPDLDATTAVRFHFAEILLTTLWKAPLVALLGVDAHAYRRFERLFLASVIFHHSNVRLPKHLDLALCALVMTPRLHGIHHSERAEEQASNWSSGLTIWDRLHGTLRLGSGATVRIGLPDRLPQTLRGTSACRNDG
jgi:sterol desaturase/sphingolipid hydroxylase (fatty acid hydroxylase superfamily)